MQKLSVKKLIMFGALSLGFNSNLVLSAPDDANESDSTERTPFLSRKHWRDAKATGKRRFGVVKSSLKEGGGQAGHERR